MSSDHKVILDLWDDEPLTSVTSSKLDNAYSKASIVASHQYLPTMETEPRQTQARSERPTPVMQPVQAPSLPNPYSERTPLHVQRQQQNTIPMPQIEPSYPLGSGSAKESPPKLHRDMPSTRPAPQQPAPQETINPPKVSLNTKLSTSYAQIVKPSNDQIKESAAENIKNIDEPWLDTSLDEQINRIQSNSIKKSTGDETSSQPIDYLNQNLQDLIDSNLQEERLHSQQRKQYSRLKEEYESSRNHEDQDTNPHSSAIPPTNQTHSDKHTDAKSITLHSDSTVASSSKKPTSMEAHDDQAPNGQTADHSQEVVKNNNDSDNIQDLPSSNELLAELFPSDRPIHIILDEAEVADAIEHEDAKVHSAVTAVDESYELDEDDIPTAPPMNRQDQFTPDTDQQLLTQHSDSSAPVNKGSEIIDDYIEPLSFTIPPQLGEPIQDYGFIKNIQLTQSQKDSNSIKVPAKADRFLGNSKRNLFKASELGGKPFLGYKPAQLLSESSLKRRQEMARVLIQGIERYATGQSSFSPIAGVTSLVFTKIYPIEIALSAELLNTQLSHVDHEETELLKDVSPEQRNEYVSDELMDTHNPKKDEERLGDTNCEQEHKEFLATVEFQTLLSGSSSVQAPQSPDDNSAVSPKNGWDLEKHLNPRLKRTSLSNRQHHKKSPPRLIKAIEPTEARTLDKVPLHTSDKELETTQSVEQNHPPITQDQPVEQASDATPHPDLQKTNKQTAQSSSSPSLSPPSKTPRPSGHPSVKVRLWGLK